MVPDTRNSIHYSSRFEKEFRGTDSEDVSDSYDVDASEIDSASL